MSQADYLKKYLSGGDSNSTNGDYLNPDDVKKKKRKKVKSIQPSGLRVLDADEHSKVHHVEKDEDSGDDLGLDLVLKARTERMKRRLDMKIGDDKTQTQTQTQTTHSDSDSHSPPRKRNNDISPPRNTRIKTEDISPPRKNPHIKSEDISPPRRRDNDNSPPRRKNNDDNSPPRKRGEDNSPPRKRNDEDNSPPRRKNNEDISPPRRRDNDNSPPRRKNNNDNSPPRKRAVDNSPPRKRGEDNSPPRKRNDDNSPSRRKNDDGSRKLMSDGHKAGLHSGKEVREQAELKLRLQKEAFDRVDPKLLGREVETVHRDRRGRKLEGLMEFKRQQEGRFVKEEEQNLEWGTGLAQKKMKEDQKTREEEEKSKPFARYRDDADLDESLKEQDRWGDPMIGLISKPVSKPKYRGPPAAPNRFNIPPGHRWDGQDRSNGFEVNLFKTQSRKTAVKEEAYLWSVSDM